MQAVTILIASIVIGIALSVAQVLYSFEQQRRAAATLSEEILTLAEGGATTSAWTLDERLAHEVVSGMIALGSVQMAVIRDDRTNILASAEKATGDRGVLLAWISRALSSGIPRGVRSLTVEDRGRTVEVGTLTIDLSPHHVANSVLQLAVSTALVTLVSAFLIGLFLLWISTRFVTSPLRHAAGQIAQIDLGRDEQMRVPVPEMHRTNELGHLLGHTNEMLSRLARSHEQLRALATRDSLTGLLNRSEIQRHLHESISQAARAGEHVAVLFLDLDRFKNVNDSLGHEAGDTLLIAVASALQCAMRSKDAVGRLGGDEFLIVLGQVDHPDEVVAAVTRLAEAISTPCLLAANEVRVAGSFGIAIYPEDGNDAGALMRRADLAMYKAKASGALQWHFFSSELGEQVEARLKIENALGGAIGRNELSLVYQPKYRAVDGAMVGCEALLRWHHNGRVVPTGDFISVAEESGLIIEIGDWVVNEACRQIAQWGKQAVPVAINVSAQQLMDGDFVDRLLAVAERYAVATSFLEIELTETVLMRDLDQSEEQLLRLVNTGFTISIDDFGTGYSSLSYLARLSISYLKIDRSFVSGERRSKVILDTILALAKALGIHTVAEGVETKEQLDSLTAQGCDLLQGYLLGRPSVPAEFERLLLHAHPCSPADTGSGDAAQVPQ